MSAKARPPKTPRVRPVAPLPFRSVAVDVTLRVLLVLAFVYMAWALLIPVLLGGVFAVVTSGLRRRLERRLGRARRLAPSLVTTLVVLLILIPTAVVVWRAVEAGNDLVAAGFPSSLASLESEIIGRLTGLFGDGASERAAIQSAIDQAFARLTRALAQMFGAAARAVPIYITDAFLFVLALYYFSRDGHRVIGFLRRLSPVQSERTDELFDSIRTTIDGTVLGIFVVALVQGGLALLALVLFRVPGAFLWGVLAAVLSVVPIVGTTPVTIGATIYLAVQGRVGAAAGMFAMAMFIGTVDNFIRPFVQSSHDHMHPLIALLAIFGGLVTFGPAGLVLGPIVAAMALWAIERAGHAEAHATAQVADAVAERVATVIDDRRADAPEP